MQGGTFRSAATRPHTETVKYRMIDLLQLDQTCFRDREISPCSQFLRGPRAHEPFADRQCLSECGEPWSSARSLPHRRRIEICFDDPLFHETVQLAWGHRTAALDAAT